MSDAMWVRMWNGAEGVGAGGGGGGLRGMITIHLCGKAFSG